MMTNVQSFRSPEEASAAGESGAEAVSQVMVDIHRDIQS
jgi:hypothetical protein